MRRKQQPKGNPLVPNHHIRAQQLHEQAQRMMNRAVELLRQATGCSEPMAIGIVVNIAGFVMSDYASRMNGYEEEL